MRVRAGEEEMEEKEREEEGKGIRWRGPIVKEKDSNVRWKGIFAKQRKQRRVAARGRGWERKKTRGRIRVCPRVCLLGFGPDWATLSRLETFLVCKN